MVYSTREKLQVQVMVICLPNGHVKNITTNGARHGHVAESFSRDNHAADQVWNTGAGGKQCQPHHFRWYANSVTGHVRPPDHQVRVCRDPEDRSKERHHEQLLP